MNYLEGRINDLEHELTTTNKQLNDALKEITALGIKLEDLETKAAGLKTVMEMQEETLQQIANLAGDS